MVQLEKCLEMKLIQINNYDESIFSKIVDLKNKIHCDIKNSQLETVEELRKIFCNEWINSEYSWIFVIAEVENNFVGRVLLSWKKGETTGSIGFLEWDNNSLIIKSLLDKVEIIAKENGLNKIKGPIDIHFFIKYRWAVSSLDEPFYGEPVVPGYYISQIESLGYKKIKTWHSYSANFKSVVESYQEKSITGSEKIKTRRIRLTEWESELKIFHTLLLKSYSSMSEFANMPYDVFYTLFKDLSYLIHPLYSFFVIYNNEEIGFHISIFDPQQILNDSKNKKINFFQKFSLLLKLRLNHKRLLCLYIGKSSTKDGKNIKGVQAMMGDRHKILGRFIPPTESFFCYVSEDSPTRKVLDIKLFKEISRYHLWSKDLE